MSTQLKPIKGLVESEHSTRENPKYEVSRLHLTVFAGGVKRGKSLQLSIGDSYSQLSNKQVLKLIKTLNKHYKVSKEPKVKQIVDKITESAHLVKVNRYGLPILDTYKSMSAGEMVDFGMIRDRNPDRDWGQLQGTNLELNPPKEVPITPELRQILLEDLAYAYGNNTSLFGEKLKEFGFI